MKKDRRVSSSASTTFPALKSHSAPSIAITKPRKPPDDQLLAEQQKIALNAEATSPATAGEGIEVIDPANLPSKPVAPKRLMLVAHWVAAGSGLGLLLVASLKDHAAHDSKHEDADTTPVAGAARSA
jgi:hypothetical protein